MNTDELKTRTGYAGKSQQWQYGFDLACREKQAEIDALKAQRDELLAAQQWRPIESAPRDGVTRILVLIGDGDGCECVIAVRDVSNMCWVSSWSGDALYPPTHWQPLPIAKARGDL